MRPDLSLGWTVVVVLLGLVRLGLPLSASFYGDSYLWLSMEDPGSETDIKLQFKTHRSDGLLFLAAGTTDYCVLELKSGMVRARIDLGSGEAALGSPRGMRFDDLQWHSVHLTRAQENVQLDIDGIYTTATTTPGRFFELNINRGVFLGGVGTFTDVFFGNFKDYRGCLQQVIFNSVDVLHGAKQDNNPLNLYGVTWDCSPEFGATSQQPISFLQNNSYIAFHPMDARKEGRVTFNIKTRSERALILFNSGHLSSSDFVAGEIVAGEIKLTVNKGSGSVDIMSGAKISDGKWHQVEIFIDITTLRLTVDGQRQETRTNFGDNRFLDLHGFMYIGGVSLQARNQALTKDLISLSGQNIGAGSLEGCLQNVKIGGQLMGFREAQVTYGLQPECIWAYPCTSDPCIEDARCTEEGFYTFECHCELDDCVKPVLPDEHPSVPINNVFTVMDIIVREAGRVILTSKTIKLQFDPQEHGLRDSQVLFRVVNLPEHGTVEVDVSRSDRQVVFTLDDLKHGKVSYVHDGTEPSTDTIGMELEFLGKKVGLPQKLRQKYGFMLIIKVAPWNDKPEIMLPVDDTLVLVENTQIRITPKVLKVDDRDDPPRHLEYTVKYQDFFNIGYFEISDSMGVRARITSFTQEDINQGKIRFIHRGRLSQVIQLQVSDGKDSSETKELKITGVPLKLNYERNTGVNVSPGGRILILRDNLTFTTNAPNQDIDIRYEVTDVPYFGELQRQQYADNTWATVSTFAQRHIDKSRLQYVHTDLISGSTEDYFKFRVVAMNEETIEHEFLINIDKSEVSLVRVTELLLNGVREDRITNENLKAVSSIASHKPRDIVYTLITMPQHGHLYHFREEEGGTKEHKQQLSVGANFTQADLNNRNIMYRVHKALDSRITDHFQYTLSVPGDISQVHRFNMRYVPIESDVRFINNGLMDVIEGDKKVITPENLYVETAAFKEFRFTVFNGPEHGFIQIIDQTTGRPVNHNSTSFTNDDLREGRVAYRNNGSEHEEDSFMFIATPIIPQPEFIVQEIFEFPEKFEIKILLVNDNPPERVVEKKFTVVTDRGRLITLQDLRYHDPDIDFDDSQLQYKIIKKVHGKIVSAENHSVPMDMFTQQDIADGKVYFQHEGENYDRVFLWVSDGQHQAAGLLEVLASHPYVRLRNNTGISVQRGQRVPILTANLSIETNLDVEDKEVKFIIQKPPAYGWLKKHNQEKNRFNLNDIKNGHMIYEHDNSLNLQDEFRFTVKVEDVHVSGEVKIKILLESHNDPPRIINGCVLDVDEGTRVNIKRSDLEVAHPETPPGEIQYTITSPPKFGKLTLRDLPSMEDLLRFTQLDINKNRLMYTEEERGPEVDTFKFDVTNGIQSLQDLECVFEIIPEIIPMEVVDFSVTEGDKKLLNTRILQLTNKHFTEGPMEFVVVKEPMNGWIESKNVPRSHLLQFTLEDLQKNVIYYGHSGNDSLSDEFTILAKSPKSGKQSNPHTLVVTIIPTNDQPPRLIVNEKLEVWTGSTTTITSNHLKAVDLDTAPDDLTYNIDTPTNGHVALADRVDEPIGNFTQGLIDRGLIVFVHTGDDEGHFYFFITDGLNHESRKRVLILARPLVLTVETNEELEVFPGIIQPILPSHFKVVTNAENETQKFVISLEKKPQKGILVRHINDTTVEVTSFTQDEIDQGIIAYKHTDEAMARWSQEDFFEFDVSTQYAESLQWQRFKIRISYLNINKANKNQLIKVTSAMVEEGGYVNIERDHMDVSSLRRRLQDSSLGHPDVNYYVNTSPMHGDLIVAGKNATTGTTFSQKDINRERVMYMHDHSDTLWDAFEFSIEIVVNKKRNKTPLSNVFNITVIPINDQTFKVLTDTPHMEMVQGSVAKITQEHLNTVDPDTPPSGIEYHVQNPPNNGILVLATNPDQAIHNYTQLDINNNKLLFIQDGSRTQNSVFYFRVSDGQHTPRYFTFQIIVHPLTLELRNTSNIKIIQGHSSATLMPDNFNVVTNGKRAKIMYNVTRPPLYGKLFMNDNPVYMFTQKNIDEGKVVYIQIDKNSAQDTFEFILYDSQNMITKQTIDITVVALVKQNPVNAPAGQMVFINKDVLDATELAIITGSNPTYIVTKYPMYGKLLRKVNPLRLKRQARNTGSREQGGTNEDYVEVNANFTHQDVEKELIAYKAGTVEGTKEVPDSFSYILTAHNAQPARGGLVIMVQPKEPVEPVGGGSLPEPDGEPGEDGESVTSLPAQETNSTVFFVPTIDPNKKPPKKTEKLSGDRIMIIAIVGCVTVITIFGLVLGRCLRHRRRKKHLYRTEQAQEDSKTPLAQHPPLAEVAAPSKEGIDRTVEVSSPTMQQASSIPIISVTQDDSYTTSPNTLPRVRGRPPKSPQTPKTPHLTRVSTTGSMNGLSRPPKGHRSRGGSLDDLDQTEISKAVPTCKVTPLFDGDDTDPKTAEGSGKHEQLTFDWEQIDPELLQHCRTTNPVLHKNKYWV